MGGRKITSKTSAQYYYIDYLLKLPPIMFKRAVLSILPLIKDCPNQHYQIRNIRPLLKPHDFILNFLNSPRNHSYLLSNLMTPFMKISLQPTQKRISKIRMNLNAEFFPTLLCKWTINKHMNYRFRLMIAQRTVRVHINMFCA